MCYISIAQKEQPPSPVLGNLIATWEGNELNSNLTPHAKINPNGLQI